MSWHKHTHTHTQTHHFVPLSSGCNHPSCGTVGSPSAAAKGEWRHVIQEQSMKQQEGAWLMWTGSVRTHHVSATMPQLQLQLSAISTWPMLVFRNCSGTGNCLQGAAILTNSYIKMATDHKWLEYLPKRVKWELFKWNRLWNANCIHISCINTSVIVI